MKILLCAATIFEISPTIDYLEKNGIKDNFSCYRLNKSSIYPYISGVGMTAMSYAIARYKEMDTIDLLVHAGFSGSFDPSLQLGSCVEVVSERFGDLGAEDKDGNILDLSELGLINSNQYPYENSCLRKIKKVPMTGLIEVKGITVNSCSGTKETIEKRKNKFNAQIESMEGAALFYAAKMLDVPFLSVRSISNYIEPRNKEAWEINLAQRSLNDFLIKYLQQVS